MVACTNLTSLTDQPKVCCVFNYDEFGGPVAGQERECIPIGLGAGDGVTELECLADISYINKDGAPITVKNGEIQECCRDCNPPPKTLVRSGGRLVRNGNALTKSPGAEPEKCCCGDECTCKQVPDCEQVRCYPTHQPPADDKCKGRCLEKAYDLAGNEILEDRTMTCATRPGCCKDDDEDCADTCSDGAEPGGVFGGGAGTEKITEQAKKTWTEMLCTNCGGCCVHNYDTDQESPTFGDILSRTLNRNTTKEACEATLYDPDDPTTPFGPIGTWYDDAQDPNICNPDCCATITRGNQKAASCRPTALTECNPCTGSCIEIARENNDWLCPRVECKTKQECCGAGNENCTPQCGAATAQYRWVANNCGTDGDKCGTCCKNIYNGDELEVINVVCDNTKTTRASCEELVTAGSGLRQYGVWHAFETCAACNSTPCCREITCPDGKTHTTCLNVAPEDCDFCNGSCLDKATGNRTCAHYRVCCGVNGEKCNTTCGVAATHEWAASCANPQKCGACCRIVYDGPGNAALVLEAECLPDIIRAVDCGLNAEDEAELRPDYDIRYSWKPFETCATAKCAQKKCCGETCPGDVGCIDIDINAACDPCKGRCYDNATETATCKTKQDCCGDDGALCRGCPGNGVDIVATDPAFTWGGCFENGTKCGVCCELTLNAAGVAVSSTCHDEDDMTYDECLALPNASWKAFETCASAICIPRTCCDDVTCPDQVICIAVDKDNGTCAAPCRGECYAIDATGAKEGDPFCATKVDCCGEQNEKCTPQPGFCPGSNTVPTHSWPNDCADPAICGVCCKRNVGAGGAITYSCDDTKDNQTDCTAANYGVWYAFGTCAACGETKQVCVEAKCKKIVTVGGVNQEFTVTNATCKPVAPDKTNCKGICTEFATAGRPYAVTTCKTKSECCGSNGGKCNNVCGSVPTHSWSSSCNDPEKCGVCCVTTNVGGGNISAGMPEENIGRADCEAKGQAGGGVGVTAVWIPLGTAQDCSIEKCCGTCPDGSISCIDQPPGTPCLQPCNGRCYTVDAAGNVDLTQPDTCATKEACCMQNGINVCQNECKPGKRWTPTCPENAIKCGVACKTTYSGTTILGAECVPGITTLAMLSAAQANLAPNETLTWKPWDTCATVICRAKKCCKEKCPGELACVDVDESDACEPCSGLCYAAVIDPVTDNYVIAPDAVPECRTRSECCGGANEKCASIASCPPQTELKVFVSCDNNCPSGDCLCTDANYAANNDIRSQTRTEPVSGRPFTHWVITEQCQSLLFSLPDPGLSTNNFVGNFNNFVNGSAYSLTYVPVQGPWIEDPCYTSCGEPPTGDADETQYNQCINEQSQLFTTPYEFKPCYPDVLAGQKVYAYAEWCSYDKHPPADYTGVADGHTSTKAGALAFYMCKDKKLVNVTDDIITKKTVKKCSYTRLVFPATTPVSVNTDVDLFNWKFCYTETATGAFTELKTDFSQSCFSGLSVCGAYASPSSEIKDPDMLGCPQPFTANPLP